MRFAKRGISNAINTSIIIGSFGVLNSGFALGYELEEVIVTAQKREQSLQEVGISVSAFSGEELRELKTETPMAIVNQVSNVNVTYGFGQPSFSIRGVAMNEFASNVDSPVAVHVDEVYLSKPFMVKFGLFDIDRVEVLKGPQGTLFGRNTTGGTVNFITRRPTEEFEGNINATYAKYDSLRLEGYVSGPLTETLSGRVSGYKLESWDSPYFNTYNGQEIGEANEYAVRAQLEWTPTDSLEMLFNLHSGQDKTEPPPYESVGAFDPGTGTLCQGYLNGTATGATSNCTNFTGYLEGDDDPYTVNQNFWPTANNEGIGVSARIEYDLSESLALTSISAYENVLRDQREDSSASPDEYLEGTWYQEIHQFTQELRLTSDHAGNFNYIAGLFYEHDELENNNNALSRDFLGAIYNSNFDQKTDATALFLHTDYQLNEQVKLIGGLRYSWERTQFDGGTYVAAAPLLGRKDEPTARLLTLAFRDDSRTDENVSFKVGVDYTPDNDWLIYTSLSTGFKSGGFNGGFPFTQEELSDFDPEEMTAFEVGFKSTLLDGELQLNGAAFFYQYDDLHVNVSRPGTISPFTQNAAKSKTVGAELDFWWKPSEQLDVKAGLGYLDAEVQDLEIVPGQVLESNNPVNAPEWSFNGLLRYETVIDSNMKLVAMTDFNWRDEHYLEVVNTPASQVDGYWLVNARLALGAEDGSWEVALWGKNLGDEEYATYINDVSSFGFVLNIYGQPRTYGVSVDYNF